MCAHLTPPPPIYKPLPTSGGTGGARTTTRTPKLSRYVPLSFTAWIRSLALWAGHLTRIGTVEKSCDLRLVLDYSGLSCQPAPTRGVGLVVHSSLLGRLAADLEVIGLMEKGTAGRADQR